MCTTDFSFQASSNGLQQTEKHGAVAKYLGQAGQRRSRSFQDRSKSTGER